MIDRGFLLRFAFATLVALPGVIRSPSVHGEEAAGSLVRRPEEVTARQGRPLLPGSAVDNLSEGIDVSISMANDNMFFGLVDLILASSYSDDLGLTYALNLQAQTVTRGGTRVTVAGSTTLFADLVPDDYPTAWWYYDERGRLFVLQSFTNRNLLTLSIDSSQAARPYFYDFTAGWLVFDSEHWDRLVNATSHQFAMHWLINELFGTELARMTVNIPNGKGVRHGVVASASLGLQSNIFFDGGSSRLRLFAAGTGGFETFGGLYIDGESGLAYYGQHASRRAAFKAELAIGAMLFDEGGTFRANVGTSARFGHLAIDLIVVQRWGDLQNVVDYDRRNFQDFIDPIMTVGVRLDFSGTWIE